MTQPPQPYFGGGTAPNVAPTPYAYPPPMAQPQAYPPPVATPCSSTAPPTAPAPSYASGYAPPPYPPSPYPTSGGGYGALPAQQPVMPTGGPPPTGPNVHVVVMESPPDASAAVVGTPAPQHNQRFGGRPTWVVVAAGACVVGLVVAVVVGVVLGTRSQRKLEFQLRWSDSVDLDLYVITPNGNTISRNNRFADGGELDHDVIPSGSGTWEEDIYWTDTPPSGTYTYYARRFSSLSSHTVSYSLYVRRDSTRVATFSGSFSDTETFRRTYTVS